MNRRLGAAFALLALAGAARAEPVRAAFLGAQFLNDHEGEEPTTDAERARLAAAEAALTSKLEAAGRYRFLPVPADAREKIAKGPVIGSCGGCEYGYGAELGAERSVWLVVQKVSNLILNMNVYIADVPKRKLAFVHSVDIRGNTEESWRRGIDYLVRNYVLKAPL